MYESLGRARSRSDRLAKPFRQPSASKELLGLAWVVLRMHVGHAPRSYRVDLDDGLLVENSVVWHSRRKDKEAAGRQRLGLARVRPSRPSPTEMFPEMTVTTSSTGWKCGGCLLRQRHRGDDALHLNPHRPHRKPRPHNSCNLVREAAAILERRGRKPIQIFARTLEVV